MDEEDEEQVEEDLEPGVTEGFSLRPSEFELFHAEAKNLTQHQVNVGLRKQFQWDDCPVWQENLPPEHRDPPWRIPGQRDSRYFQIDEIERFLLHGDHPLNESNE